MSHKVKYLIDGEGKHTAHCKRPCSWHADHHQWQWQVEDEWREHLAYVERIKAHLGTFNPSLKSQRDYYADRAENDPDVEHRPLWRQLAQELSHRLNDDGASVSMQDELPFLD